MSHSRRPKTLPRTFREHTLLSRVVRLLNPPEYHPRRPRNIKRP